MRKKILKAGLLALLIMVMSVFPVSAATIPIGEIDWFQEGGLYFRGVSLVPENGSYVKQDNGYSANSSWRWLNVNENLSVNNNHERLACYYMGEDGFILYDTTTPDGYTVDEWGRWTVDGVVQWKEISDIYVKPELNRNVYDSDGLAYAVKDIMTMRPDDSIAKYGASYVERYKINSETTDESLRIAYNNLILADMYTNPDGSIGSCRLGSNIFSVKSLILADAYFAYIPEFHSPANFYLDEAVKYYEAMGYKKVNLTEDIQDGEFYLINDVSKNKAPNQLRIVVGDYIVSFDYQHSINSPWLTEMRGNPITIWRKDVRVKFDLPYATGQ